TLCKSDADHAYYRARVLLLSTLGISVDLSGTDQCSTSDSTSKEVEPSVFRERKHIALQHGRVNNGRLDLSVSDIKYCFETEPCQFGQYKQSQNDLLVYMIIPSWCTCNSHQSCQVDRWDRVRKAEIYTCQSNLE
ncbi:hypothetical protein TTRE_0000763101, partial [Trichuris trichiura]